MDAGVVNRMLDQRVKDLASRPGPGTPDERRYALRKCLGLEPIPARPEPVVELLGVVERDGYRIEKLRYDSSTDVPVTAHLYMGDGDEKRPLVLRPHDHWPFGMRAPVVQAGAISLALHGFACLVVACPGMPWLDDGGPIVERQEMGEHEDPFLAMGAPVQGRYVWDLIRALDAMALRSDIDMAHIGVTGEGTAADTASYVFALDERITAAVVVAGVESREIYPTGGCMCRAVPAVAAVGDRADILALRAPHGRLMVLAGEIDGAYQLEGHERTNAKLQKAFRNRHGTQGYRFEQFYSGHDYNRRMRECALAFFTEHLCGGPASPICPEARPLTDGFLNAYPSGTLEPGDEVLSTPEPRSLTFRELLDQALSNSAPQPYRVEQHLVTWRKYGTMPPLHPGAIFAIHDSTVAEPAEPGSIRLPEREIDIRLCTLLGLSIAEVLAQMCHVFLPGGPESWESSSTGISNDPLTSMIASMKTLVTTPEAPPKMVVAEGPVASMVARFLARYRPQLQVQATHLWTNWSQAFEQEIAPNAQPLARYLDFV
jgi:hypothetical protein